MPELLAYQSHDKKTGNTRFDPAIYDESSGNWVRSVPQGSSVVPTQQEAFKEFAPLFSVVQDQRSGLVTLSVRHQSPYVAQKWLAYIINDVNEEFRQKDISEAEKSIGFLHAQRRQTSLVSLDEVFSGLIEEQTKTIMLANVATEYIFEVIDPPVISEVPCRAEQGSHMLTWWANWLCSWGSSCACPVFHLRHFLQC